MYLKELIIKNFRGINELTIQFHDGVNIIIGENNTCKTAIIDALRLAFNIGSERKEIYIRQEDFYIDKYGDRANMIEFHLTYSDLKEEDKGIFIEMLSIDEHNNAFLKLHINYELLVVNASERIKPKYWGGENEGN